MPIDDRLRTGLPTALEDVSPDVDAMLAGVLDRAGRRTRVRRMAYGGAVAAAAAVTAVTFLGADDSQRSVEPVTPTGQVLVLDSGRGSADEPAPLDAGTYAIPFIGSSDDAPWAELQVPTGWAQDRLLLATGPDLDPHLRRIELLAVTRIAPDPCQGNLQPVRATVPAIVRALSKQPTVKPSEPQPVTIDRYSGQLMEFQVPTELDAEACEATTSLMPFGAGGGWVSVFPGWTYRTWVLDIKGEPLVIMAAHGPETTSTELAELDAIVEDINFVAPR